MKIALLAVHVCNVQLEQKNSVLRINKAIEFLFEIFHPFANITQEALHNLRSLGGRWAIK